METTIKAIIEKAIEEKRTFVLKSHTGRELFRSTDLSAVSAEANKYESWTGNPTTIAIEK